MNYLTIVTGDIQTKMLPLADLLDSSSAISKLLYFITIGLCKCTYMGIRILAETLSLFQDTVPDPA